MAGITRIRIKPEQGKSTMGWRVKWAQAHEDAINTLYRQMFAKAGVKLTEGDEIELVNKEDLKGRYDHTEGIDIMLSFLDGSPATLQEKILSWVQDTVTFEVNKSSGLPGAWYYCTAQYYSVFYDRDVATLEKFKTLAQDNPGEPISRIDTGIILNLAALRVAANSKTLKWGGNQNAKDGRRSTFRFINFKDIPSECIVATHNWEVAKPPTSPFIVPIPAPLTTQQLRDQLLTAYKDSPLAGIQTMNQMIAELVAIATKRAA